MNRSNKTIEELNNELEDLQTRFDALKTSYDITCSNHKQTELRLKQEEENYHTIFSAAGEAIFIHEANTGKIIEVNDNMLKTYGYTSKEEIYKCTIGDLSANISPYDEITARKFIEKTLNEGPQTFEWLARKKEGTLFWVEIKLSKTNIRGEGLIIAFGRDITERKRTEERIIKLNRIYALISQINQIIIRTHCRENLFEDTCNIAVQYGKFQMAWIGLVDNYTELVKPVTFAGNEEGYLSKIKHISIKETPEGCGPTGTAIREGRHYICNDIANDPKMVPWRDEALKRGYQSSIAMPILFFGKPIGALSLYATTPYFFDQDEIILLDEVTNNISFALEAIENEKQRQNAEFLLREKNAEIEAQNEEYLQVNEELSEINDELNLAKKLAEESELKYKQLFDNTLDHIFIFDVTDDLRYKVVAANPTQQKEIGIFEPDTFVEDRFPPELYSHFKRNYDHCVNLGHIYSYEETLNFQNTPQTFYTQLIPIKDEEGKVWRIIGIAKNITEEKKLTDQLKSQNETLKRLNADLLIAKDQAEESDRLKTAFLQNMSHEIRTPMNAIMGFTSLLAECSNDKAKLQKFTTIINQRCNDLLDIINDLLDIAKIEAGQLPVNLEECNLIDLFGELYSFFSEYQKRIGKPQIELNLQSYCFSEFNIIITDKVKLKQIFINLISNAFKFTEHGKIDAGCKLDENNRIIFYVTDTGIGIPADKQNVIFERFTQLMQVSNKNTGGTGLGLPIVKGLVELLGGKISLTSEPGKGSSFSFSLNYQLAQPKHSDLLSSEKGIDQKMGNKTILIVEDDVYNAEYLNEIFLNTGLHILQAENGQKAVELSLNQPVDLILMDIRLPDIDGYEATRLIKQHKPMLKIIAQTAFASFDEKKRALDAGCNDYISKPTNRDQLLTMVNTHLTTGLY
jgi:PAS domain S-box-containing protein